MYTKLLQIFFASALVQFSLFGQNGLEITTRINGNYDEQRSLNISVNDAGKELYVFEKTLIPHQSIPQIKVLSNSNLLLVHSLEGIIEIYNSKGSLVSKNEFYKLPPFNEQRILFDIFDSGITLLVSESQKNNIYILDNNGNINYSKDIKDGLVKGLAVNKNAKFIACSIMNWNFDNIEYEIIITNTKNNLGINFSDQFENGMFNEFDNLFLGITNRSVFLYNLTEQKTLWSDKLDDNRLFVDANILKNKALLVQSNIPLLIDNDWIYEGIEIIQKNENGIEEVLYSDKRKVKIIELNKIESKFHVKLDDEIIEFNID
jgi:hypothetical protein